MAKLLEATEEGINVRTEVIDRKKRQTLVQSSPSAFSDARAAEDDSYKGAVIGALVGWDASGNPLVDFHDNPAPAPVSSRATVALRDSDINREVVLLFVGDDRRSPIVMGVIQPPGDTENGSALTRSETERAVRVEADGQRLVLTADKEIVLNCGASSIVLTRAGKILIRGSYLVSRASGTNRIKGGSVQIN
jgi:hypothetical protein